MRLLSVILACSLITSSLLAAEAVSTTLTLVEEEGFNKITIEVGSSGVSDSDTTTLSGSTEAQLTIDPATGRASEMTLEGGRFTATDLNFSAGAPPFAGFTATSEDPSGNSKVGGTLTTTDPPARLTPEAEEGKSSFDASQFNFTIDSGILFVTVYVPFQPASESEFNFNTNPVTGPGEGEGTICLTETDRSEDEITYDVVVVFPVLLDQTIMEPGSPEVSVKAVGTVKAAGSVTVPNLSAYEQWAAENDVPDAPFAGDASGDGVANGVQWALGLAVPDSPFPHLLRPSAPRVFTVTLPAGGSAAPLSVQVSDDPGTAPFVPLPADAVSAGNPIPAGTSGTVTITLPTAGRGFVQLLATEP